MNSLLKAFMGISLGYTVIMLFFWNQFGLIPFLMFFAAYIPLAGIVIWDEFKTPADWPVKVFLFERREGSERLIITRAKRIKDKFGKYFYVIKGRKGKTKPIAFEHITTYKSGFRGEDVVMFYSPAPEQYHPITMEKADEISKKLKVIPQELLDYFIETFRDQYAAHPDKKKGWAILFENPLLLCSIAFVILLIGLGIFIMQFLMPAIQQGQIMGAQIQLNSQILEAQEKVSGLLLERMNILFEKLGYIPINQTLLPKP